MLGYHCFSGTIYSLNAHRKFEEPVKLMAVNFVSPKIVSFSLTVFLLLLLFKGVIGVRFNENSYYLALNKCLSRFIFLLNRVMNCFHK